MPDFWTIKGIGDLVGVIGLVVGVLGLGVALVGFTLAVSEARKAVTAAQAAKKAAEEARASINLFETIVDFAAGIAALEEIQRLHRLPETRPMLLERYRAGRKLLILLRNSKLNMHADQERIIQRALSNLADMERQLEKFPDTFKPAKNNTLISSDIDALLAVLAQLKSQTNGGSS